MGTDGGKKGECDRQASGHYYPPYVSTDEEQARWDLAAGIAEQIFGGDGPAAVWMAARSIHNSPVPTGELPEHRADGVREKPPIPMIPNEPGHYLNVPDPGRLQDLEPEARAEVEAELAKRREARRT